MIERPVTMMMEVPVTKRKAFTFILDKSGEVLFTSSDCSQAFEWLILNEVFHIILKTPGSEMNLYLDESTNHRRFS